MRSSSIGAVLDAGAFIALGRRSPATVRLMARIVGARLPLVTSGGVVARVWRGGGGRQAPVAMLLRGVEVVPLDASEGKLVGMLLGRSATDDAVDGHVALLARERGFAVLTSDADDLLRIDPQLDVIEV
jgi:hypothetical protein